MEDEFDIVYRQLFRKYYANLLFYATRMVGEMPRMWCRKCLWSSGTEETV